MKGKMRRPLCMLLSGVIAATPLAQAQTPAPAAPAAQAAATGQVFKQEELDALLAPIALYPDALLAQIMMASTYPLEVVEAARWQKANASLKGTALEDAARQQSWDESVKSLVMFPDVLSRMNQDLTWTQKLGDAFLGQQAQVLATVQSLRQRAQAAGNLASNEQQKVETQTQEGKQVIVIQPANPQIVYVPTYQPTYVYGPWLYPAYPPYYPSYWAPVGAPFVRGFFWGAGVAAGAALWGGYNWGRGEVNINVNRYNNYNRTNISNNNWNHNVDHRGSVPYRDQGSRDKYGKYDRQAAQSREQFRGRDDALGGKGLSDRAALSDARDRGVGSAGDRSGAAPGAGQRDLGGAQAGTRDLGGASSRGGGAQAGTRDIGAASAQRGGAFSGGNGGQTRAASDRGRASMASAPARAPSAGAARSGGARGGGGGRR